MGFYQEYELLGLVHDGPTKTLRAREIATDRSVFLHLLTGALPSDAQRALLARVDGLITQSAEVLRVGEFAGTRYVVTGVLDPFSNLEEWVSERASSAGSRAPESASSTVAQQNEQHSSNGSSSDPYQTAVHDRGPSDASTYAGLGGATHSHFDATQQEITVQPEHALRELTAAPGASDGPPEAVQPYAESDALTNALESLETALKLRPDDPEEIARAEATGVGFGSSAEDEPQTRKEWHYSKAREAWEQGDLDAALEEMERLAAIEDQHPAKDPERSRAYVEFHRQVRSESQAVSNSYAEARAQMAEENLAAAFEICERTLAKYPKQALFQALKFELGARRRQESLAFVADTDRRVETEPDLLKRIEILEEALQRYPGERHFEEGIHLVREKHELVRSIIEKAYGFEQTQRFREALDQWQLIESIHPQMPGLEAGIKRIEQRMQEQRMRHEARARWIAQTKRCLQAGDYEQGLQLVRNALTECPDDAELRQLELEAGRGLQKGDTVRDHLRQAQSLWQSGRRMEGLESLRQAHQLDPKNALVRGELVNALVELARRQVEADWAAAKPMVEEILHLEPNHTAAVHLLEQISHLKREELVSWCLVETRRLRSRGDLEGAYRVVAESLEQYPQEDRLVQLEAGLAQEVDPSVLRENQAQPDPEVPEAPAQYAGDTVESYENYSQEMRQESSALLAHADYESGYQEPPENLQEPGTPHTRGMDTMIGSPVEQTDDAAAPVTTPLENALPEIFEESLQSKQASQPGRPVSPVKGRYDATQTDPDLLSRLAVESDSQNRLKPKPAQPPAPALEAGLPARVAGLPLKPVFIGAIVAIVLVGIIAAILISKINSRVPTAPAAANLVVSIQSSPPGAMLMVDGKECGVSTCDVELPADTHRVDAQLAGYRTASVSFELNDSNKDQPVIVTLLPILPAVRISSDLSAGDISLDGTKIGELEDGSFESDLTDLTPGRHVLKLSNSDSSATVQFEIGSGGAPQITAPLKVANLKAVLVAGLGASALVYGNEDGLPVALDGQPAGKIGADGLALQNLSQGAHELTLGDGKDQRKAMFDSDEGPLLAAFLNSDRNVGSLRIVTGEDDVKIFLNGQEFRRKTIRGRRLIYLTPKDYEVRVEKDGFRTPPAQMAKLEKGAQVQLEFELTPLPQTATLRISNAVPGTEVFIDGQSRGIARANVFTLPTIEPGRHTVRLINESYKTLEMEREFSPRAVVEINGTMEVAIGTLEIQLTPVNVDVQMALRREGEASARPINDRKLTLSPGTYTLQASAAGFENFSTTFQISANQIKIAIVSLKKIEEEKPAQPALSMADWETTGWAREGKMLVKRGGDFSIAAGSGGVGHYTFTALLQKGKRLEWVVDYTDKDNHVLYQLGKDFLHRTEIVSGKKSRTVKLPHQMKWDDFLTVEVSVRSDSIVQRLLVNDKWVEVDNWKQPGSHFQSGKFGFHIPGRDQVALSHFTFVPEP